MRKTIHITGHSTQTVKFGTKHTVQDGSVKFGFYESRKDGNKTKAFEQWNNLNLTVGNEIDAEVEEERKTFKNDAGKEVPYTQRTIMFFYTDESPVRTNAPSNDSQLDRIEATLAKILKALGREVADPAEPTDLPF